MLKQKNHAPAVVDSEVDASPLVVAQMALEFWGPVMACVDLPF